MGDTVELRSPIGLMQLFDDGVIVHTIDEGAIVDAKADQKMEPVKTAGMTTTIDPPFPCFTICCDAARTP